jgi:hypothetical protein
LYTRKLELFALLFEAFTRVQTSQSCTSQPAQTPTQEQAPGEYADDCAAMLPFLPSNSGRGTIRPGRIGAKA